LNIINNISVKLLSVVVTVVSGVAVARSQSTLTWKFDQTNFVVQPTEQILLTGTVTNSSDTPYFIQAGASSFTGNLQDTYHFSWLLNVYHQTVPADGVLHFKFGTLTPIGGYVKLGVYQADPVSNPAFINFAGLSGLQYLNLSQNGFTITVVPEPSVICLGGVGVAFLLMSVFKKLGG
jgi:hypothetical protein